MSCVQNHLIYGSEAEIKHFELENTKLIDPVIRN